MVLARRFAARLLAILLLIPALAMSQPNERVADGAVQNPTDESRKEHAKQLYQEGLTAYRAGRYSDAIDRLLEADRVMPNAAFSYNIALVYQAMGDNRSALRWLRSNLRQSPNKEDKAALEKVRILEAELQTKGLQQVTILSKPSGATLRVDGSALGITPFTTEIVPGAHSVVLTLDGYKTAQTSFELRPDRSMDVEVALELSGPAISNSPVPPAIGSNPSSPNSAPPATLPLAAPAPVSIPPNTAPPPRTVRPLTLISLGLSAVLVGGSVYFELKRRSAESEAQSASQLEYQADYDKMKSQQTAARILVAGGAVALTAGLVLLTVDLTRTGPVRTANLRSCGIAGFCTALEGHF